MKEVCVMRGVDLMLRVVTRATGWNQGTTNVAAGQRCAILTHRMFCAYVYACYATHHNTAIMTYDVWCAINCIR